VYPRSSSQPRGIGRFGSHQRFVVNRRLHPLAAATSSPAGPRPSLILAFSNSKLSLPTAMSVGTPWASLSPSAHGVSAGSGSLTKIFRYGEGCGQPAATTIGGGVCTSVLPISGRRVSRAVRGPHGALCRWMRSRCRRARHPRCVSCQAAHLSPAAGHPAPNPMLLSVLGAKLWWRDAEVGGYRGDRVCASVWVDAWSGFAR
jgi:hypothetical protein